MNTNSHRILVINGKGGCGKTTIATNLAVTYANADIGVALFDQDPQASSTYWQQQRPQDLPPVHVVPAFKPTNMYQTQAFRNRLPAGTKRIIIDAQSNVTEADLGKLLKDTDLVLVPILPSPIDINAGGRFITNLLTNRIFRRSPIPVGIIANRVQANTLTHNKLQHFLGCLDVPCVATFRDSAAYTLAAETGRGLADMRSSRAARRDVGRWHKLTAWIDQQLSSAKPLPKKSPKQAQHNRQSDFTERA